MPQYQKELSKVSAGGEPPLPALPHHPYSPASPPTLTLGLEVVSVTNKTSFPL